MSNNLAILKPEQNVEKVEEVKVNVDDSTLGKWDGGNPDIFAEITKEVLGPVVQRDILLKVPHGEFEEPVIYNNAGEEKEKMFHIFIWSSPTDIGRNTRPSEKVWGIPVSCRDDAYKFSGCGAPIKNDDDGYVVATVLPNNIYIHHDICHKGSEDELKLYREVLESAKRVFDDDGVFNFDLWLSRQNEKNRDLYVQKSFEAIEENISDIKVNLKRRRSEVDGLQSEIVRLIRNQNQDYIMLEVLKEKRKTSKPQIEAEFDNMLSVPKIKGVSITENGFFVFTKTLYCENPETSKVHEIGEFLIEINSKNSSDVSGVIKWHNLTRKIDAFEPKMNAPHVYPNGTACLGNIAESVAELVAQHRYYHLIQLAIQFIEKVNVTDAAGQHIVSWPVVEEETKDSEDEEQKEREEE